MIIPFPKRRSVGRTSSRPVNDTSASIRAMPVRIVMKPMVVEPADPAEVSAILKALRENSDFS